jgi:hypothetical protein
VAVTVAPGVWRDAPLVISFHSSPAIRALNKALLWRLGRNRRRHPINRAVLWSLSPMAIAASIAIGTRRLFITVWTTLQGLQPTPALQLLPAEAVRRVVMPGRIEEVKWTAARPNRAGSGG